MGNLVYQNKDIKEEIKKTLYGYVKAESFSNSKGEKDAEDYFINYFSSKKYFKENPQYYGRYKIEDDAFDRCVSWAMVKGKSNKTVVLIHHNDVVTVEDYKSLKEYAFSPDELYKKLKEMKETFSEETKEDIESEKYLFARGVCDMKGGGSIQMSLLSMYSEEENLEGNVIVVAVPDEENLSAGMRSAVKLLDELREKYNLEYKMMINSEPHQRKDKEKGMFSLGTIGKIMPYVYVRGFLAHAGKVFEGLNPVNIMSQIVRNTEVNMDLSDIVGDEAAPPPTWLYLRENKISYDVSMPLTITGCLSILTLNQNPKDTLDKLRVICEKSMKTVIDDMNENYMRFAKATGRKEEKLPWEVRVLEFNQLYEEAVRDYGKEFKEEYEKYLDTLKEEIEKGERTLITANFALVDFVYNYVNDMSPAVIYGLIPPYYPNVANILMENIGEKERDIYISLQEYTKEKFNQEYEIEHFYTGISDLSYASIVDSEEVIESLKNSMPFYGNIYKLPIEVIERNAMGCINIGPWGKDFHKVSERVLKEDLYERTPQILDYAIRLLLAQ